MTKQPERRNPRQTSTSDAQSDPIESQTDLEATDPQSSKRSLLPLIFGGGIALALLCAIAFVIYSFYFYNPNTVSVLEEATPTLEVIDFVAGSDQPQVAPDNTDQVTPPVPPATDTDSNSESAPDEQPAPDSEPAADTQPVPDSEPAVDTQPVPDSEPVVDTQPVPDSEPVVDTQPVPDAPAVTGLSKMKSPDYGIQAFLYWRSEVASRDLQLIKDIKFDWVKQQIAWRDVEGAGKGIFDWANLDRMMDQIDEKGLNLIARVDLQPEWAGGGYPEIGPPDNYQDFVDFVRALATRYKGRIDAYQIWNEPNLTREWGNRPPNPAEYTELLRLSYEAIKAIDPEAIVISAGLAPTTRWDDVALPDTVFVQGMYDAGAQPYFDALGVHGAGYKVPPATDPAVVANDPALNNNDPSPPELKRIYAFRHVEDLRKIMVQNGDEAKRVVVLEFGWTVDDREGSPYRWHAVRENEQAAYIVQAYQYAEQNWQPWIGVMSLIFLANIDWTEDDEQTYWSITYPLYPELRARPAYWGLMDASKNR